jgi:tryptophanyl-tRNA synthetase
MKEPDQIDKILGNGAAKAAKIANPILEQTYDIVGLIRSK